MDILKKLIPAPTKITKKQGTLNLFDAIISFTEPFEDEAEMLYSFIDEKTDAYFEHELSMLNFLDDEEDDSESDEYVMIRIEKVSSKVIPEQGYSLSINGQENVIVERYGNSKLCRGVIKIVASDKAGAFYGIQTLKQIYRLSELYTNNEGGLLKKLEDKYESNMLSFEIPFDRKTADNNLFRLLEEDIYEEFSTELPNCEIYDEPAIKTRGYYFDVTRGKVPTLEYLTDIVDVLAEYKYNQLQLYVEHTYAFKNFSELWRDTDPLTREEILELDEYCKERHIELVPSLSTFGHLYMLLRTSKYKHLCEMPEELFEPYNLIDRMSHHTIDVSSDESIKVISEMIDEYAELFTSDKFNICCDETWDLGNYKTAELAKEVGKENLYVEYLLKLISYVKSKGLTPMCWADILKTTPELIDRLPKDVILLNWGYNAEVEDDFIKIASEKKYHQYVCPGVNGWNRFIHTYGTGFANINLMTSYAYKYGADAVLLTDWGDMGNINIFTLSIPLLMYQADIAWNQKSLKPITSAEQLKYMDMFTLLHMGDREGKIGKLLLEAGGLSKFILKDIIGHFLLKEYNYLHPWHHETSYCEILTLEELEKANESLTAIFNEYLIETEKIQEYDIDIMEFEIFDEIRVALLGTLLLNDYFIYRHKKDEYDADKKENFATAIEYFAQDFKYQWRLKNKESQLKDVLSILFKIADEVREK